MCAVREGRASGVRLPGGAVLDARSLEAKPQPPFDSGPDAGQERERQSAVEEVEDACALEVGV